ncbi:NBS-LRR type resistance protein [Cucumis melo var. makuwa]|uniref:NBS-LRR type resistance protein n=1 Tax=Cucumis melo var. makuwa TaxID=1194695 RepID=A0A5A7TGE9_CUCMM|nr:NBS-LRR type resistance protein [Cucumis melo var. makuwa]
MHHTLGTALEIRSISDAVVVCVGNGGAFSMSRAPRPTLPSLLSSVAAVYRRTLSYGSLFVLNNFVVDFGWLSYSYGVGRMRRLKYLVVNNEVVLAILQLWCPCKRCMNLNWNSLEGVERHLLTIGISLYYTEWVYRGESLSFRAPIEQEEETEERPFKDEIPMNIGLLDRSSLTIIATGQSRFYNDSMSSLSKEESRSTMWSYSDKHTFNPGRSCRRPKRMRIIKRFNSSPSLPQRIVSHSLRMRYAIRCWSTKREIQLQAKLDEALERIEEQTRNHQALTSEVEQMQKPIQDTTRAQQGPPHDP